MEEENIGGLTTTTTLLEYSTDDDDDDDDIEVVAAAAKNNASQPTNKENQKKKKKQKKQQRQKQSNNNNNNEFSEEKEAEYMQRYLEELEQERQSYIERWKRQSSRKKIMSSSSSKNNKTFDKQRTLSFHNSIEQVWYEMILANMEVFISNIPLTIGAVGLGWVTQGVVWFKFMEENIGDDICVTARYHSNECSYPEFPGCFNCDTNNPIYRTTVTFHYFCNFVGAFCCLLFLLKIVLAWQVVADELSNPATATPMGVVCITMVCVFAGRGLIGEIVVLVTSIFHFFLAFWFLYSAIFQFRLLPDPGWFPNTVGVSYAAIKTWLYYPMAGKFLMVWAMIFFFSTYFISIYRVIMNHKIAAPVCFIQLSAPSITMYAMTIMAQPSRQREEQLEASPELMTHFQEVHRDLYMPVMHTMMFLSLIGMFSVLHSLWARWPKFRLHEFSPAHVAFVFPLLSHTNAVQAYRSGVDSFSSIPVGSPFKIALFTYWFVCLVAGTTVNLIFTYKYVRRLPRWTKVEVGDEEEPAAPADTLLHEMLVESDVHETMSHSLVSPALLQANEAGSLIRVRRGSRDFRQHGPFVRTRRVTALGFDFVMSESELRQERAELLDWAAKNAPRSRNKTLSIPMMMKLQDKYGRGVYGTFNNAEDSLEAGGHKRSTTML